jgi:hypothetical protein
MVSSCECIDYEGAGDSTTPVADPYCPLMQQPLSVHLQWPAIGVFGWRVEQPIVPDDGAREPM